jgi:hypothetical protein
MALLAGRWNAVRSHLARPGLGWLLAVSITLGCANERTVSNPFPEGRDTVLLEPAGTVLHGERAEVGPPVAFVALDVSRAGILVAADALGRVTLMSPNEPHPRRFELPHVDGQPPLLTGVGVLPDGRVVVREARRGRVSIHDHQGSEVRAWAVGGGRPPHGRDALLVADDGTLLLGIGPDFSRSTPRLGYPRAVYQRVRIDGTVLDTLWIDDGVAAECPTPSEERFRAGWFEDLRSRHVPKPLWGIGRDGTLAYGCPARYAFTVRSPGGRRIEVSRSWRPLAVSAQERKDFVALWTTQMNASGARPGWNWHDANLPEVRPAFQRLLMADDGRVWVWPARPTVQNPAPPDWPLAGLPSVIWSAASTGAFDVFEADGRLRGHVRLPERLPYTSLPDTPDPVIRGDTLWAVTVADDGVSAVERFRVRW